MKRHIIMIMAISAMMTAGCTKYQQCRCVSYDIQRTPEGNITSKPLGETSSSVLSGESCSRLNQYQDDNPTLECTPTN